MHHSQVCLHVTGCAVADNSTHRATAGPARTSYHGVPRVFLSRPAEQLQCDSTADHDRGFTAAEDDRSLDAATAEFISRARINVSIRQVTGCITAQQQA